LAAGPDGDVSTDRGSWSDGDEITDLGACDEDISVDVAVSPYTGFWADSGMCAYHRAWKGLYGLVEGCCGMYSARCFCWDVHLFPNPRIVVADQILIELFNVDTGAENVRAVDVIVEEPNEVLAGCGNDGSDVLPMTTSTKDNQPGVHS